MTTTFVPPPSPPPTPAMPETSLSTQERLRLAKRRRAAQMKRWSQREREKASQPDVVRAATANRSKRKNNGNRGIKFVPNVMLLEAAARNDIEEVRRLLELGVSPDSTNEDGLTALHQCCIDDSEEMMKLLIDYGGNPNATDTEKWTPLHAAATCGHLHLVKFLIDHGADLLAVNADGNMPYDLCEDDTTLSYIENEMAKRGVTQELIDDTRASTEKQMLKDLQSAPSDMLEWRDKQGATPLHIAAANGYINVVEYLLDNHVATDSVDNDLWQPIHAAACWGHLEVVEILAQNGADINAKTKNGETPFDICEDPEIKERLIQLKEQKVRSEQPRVRRSRSASTRTQSIRRTSLREKMNVTKKDVQEEKLYFIQSFDALPNGDGKIPDSLESPTSGSASKPVVDINDVEVSIPPQYLRSPSSDSHLDSLERNQPTIPPKRPPRTGQSYQLSSVDSTSSLSSSSNLGDKINIHVSVTINAPTTTSVTTPGISSFGQITQPTPGMAGISGTTLSDLKKARSMSRNIVSSSSTASALSTSSTSSPNRHGHDPQHAHFHSTNLNPPPLKPFFHSDLQPHNLHQPPTSSQHPRQDLSSAEMAQPNASYRDDRNGVPKFSASGVDVVGSGNKKKGCCIIV